MTWVLWVALAVVVVGGAFVIFRALHNVLKAARALQQHVETLGDQVNAELKSLGGDMAELGESLEKSRHQR
jgi:cytochrome c-type biogenesis protein CcmH/NrfF